MAFNFNYNMHLLWREMEQGERVVLQMGGVRYEFEMQENGRLKLVGGRSLLPHTG